MSLISDLRIKNSNRNINILFHAIFTAEYKETIIATLVLIFCNMCQASDDKHISDISAVALPFFFFFAVEVVAGASAMQSGVVPTSRIIGVYTGRSPDRNGRCLILC